MPIPRAFRPDLPSFRQGKDAEAALLAGAPTSSEGARHAPHSFSPDFHGALQPLRRLPACHGHHQSSWAGTIGCVARLRRQPHAVPAAYPADRAAPSQDLRIERRGRRQRAAGAVRAVFGRRGRHPCVRATGRRSTAHGQPACSLIGRAEGAARRPSGLFLRHRLDRSPLGDAGKRPVAPVLRTAQPRSGMGPHPEPASRAGRSRTRRNHRR